MPSVRLSDINIHLAMTSFYSANLERWQFPTLPLRSLPSLFALFHSRNTIISIASIITLKEIDSHLKLLITDPSSLIVITNWSFPHFLHLSHIFSCSTLKFIFRLVPKSQCLLHYTPFFPLLLPPPRFTLFIFPTLTTRTTTHALSPHFIFYPSYYTLWSD